MILFFFLAFILYFVFFFEHNFYSTVKDILMENSEAEFRLFFFLFPECCDVLRRLAL